MDWIDPRHAKKLQRSTKKHNTPTAPKNNLLANQLRAALASPTNIWGTAYGHAIDELKWPKGCSGLTTFAWSCTKFEHLAVLKLAGIDQTALDDLLRPKGTARVSANIESPEEPHTTIDEIDSSPTLFTDEPDLEQAADQWLDDMHCQPEAALAAIAFAWQIPEYATRPAYNWLGRWLQDAAHRLQRQKPSDEDAAICHLVVRCELPLLLSVAAGASRKSILPIAQDAMDDLALLLEQGEENPACWLAYGASYLRASLASVLRARVLANRLDLRAWYPPQKAGLASLIRHAVMWTSNSGAALLGEIPGPRKSNEVWNALLSQTRKPQSLVRSMSLIGVGRRPIEPSSARKKMSHSEIGSLSHHNEEARCASMFSDWMHRAGRVALDYSDVTARVEIIGMKGQTVLCGDWTAQVEFNGQSQLQLDDWERVCWFSDEDVDYLEMEAKFGQACCVQRQIILFREERMVVVADALLASQDGKWTLTASLPIAPGCELQTSDKNTELFITSSQRDRALVIPLAMPEWRRQATHSRLGSRDKKLSIRSETQASRLYAPVIICLNGKHATKPFTWRRLTVGENMSIVTPDVAAAFRAQIGKEQWVLYRTLANPTRRTAMGLHTGADFLAARFDAQSAEFETLVEVEAEES